MARTVNQVSAIQEQIKKAFESNQSRSVRAPAHVTHIVDTKTSTPFHRSQPQASACHERRHPVEEACILWHPGPPMRVDIVGQWPGCNVLRAETDDISGHRVIRCASTHRQRSRAQGCRQTSSVYPASYSMQNLAENQIGPLIISLWAYFVD